MLRRVAVSAGFLCLALSLLHAGEWPGLRGPSGDGTVRDARLFGDAEAGLALGWKVELGSGYSAVAVAGGRAVTMFAAGENDVVAAFDVDSGEELWRYVIGQTYAGHDGSHDGPISTPRIAGDRVYGLGPRGHLFALAADSGEPVWATHVSDEHGATKPYYGFSTSPVLSDGILVVEIGGEEGRAIAGFDAATGEQKWTAGDDAINYQSPILATIAGRRQVLAVGDTKLFGIDPASGEVLWSYEHGGDGRAMSSGSIIPVPVGEGRFFINNTMDSSSMLQVGTSDGAWEVSELWTTNALRSSYVTPVYHDGHLYGMNNRIFTCIDAETGEVNWRSRQPGDGFPTVVGDKLVVITKPGSLHVIDASPEGYDELVRMDLFDEHSWSEVAYADGHLFLRSMAALARVDPSGRETGGTRSEHAWIAGTEFGAFLKDVAGVDGAEGKAAAIDTYLAEQRSFPIVEKPDVVHFVFRGEARDVGIVGDIIGFRREDPLTRVSDTDLFFYSTRLEPNAAASYGFIVDYGDAAPDPRNPRTASGLFGDVSWFAMPAWEGPAFDADAEPRGRLETVEWDSEVKEGEKRTARVYLPVGYDEGDRRYPTVYFPAGESALEEGKMQAALDGLLGDRVEPLIAVFAISPDPEDRRELGDVDGYMEMLKKELIPLVDERYRTLDDPSRRGIAGVASSGRVALVGAFSNPDVFRRVACQSPIVGVDTLAEIVTSPDEQPFVIYMNWGTYHMRSPHEAWDLSEDNRAIWSMLRERGFHPAGGELPEGIAWEIWQAHIDEMLAALFPAG